MKATIVSSKSYLIFFALLALTVLFLLSLFVSTPALAFETQITTTTFSQYQPAIYGNKVAWEDSRSYYEIYMHNLTTGIESPITTATVDRFNPVIYGDKVFWWEDRNGNYDIYMYNLTTGVESAITTATDDQQNPDRKSTRLNSSHIPLSRMPSSA